MASAGMLKVFWSRLAVQFLGVTNIRAQVVAILHAHEVRGVCGVPPPLVLGNLRIGAERSGESNIAVRRNVVRELRRYDPVRRYALVDPAIDSGDKVVIRILWVTRIVGSIENIRARSGEAMAHTRCHEEAEEVFGLLQRLAITAKMFLAPLRRDDGIVVLKARYRVDENVAPALIEDRFAATLLECRTSGLMTL
jgi:hypothetical protein